MSKKFEEAESASKRKRSQETIITQRAKAGKSETTESIEGHLILQLIHWLQTNRNGEELKAQRKGSLLSNRNIGGSNSSAVVKFYFLVKDPNRGSQMKKIQPHQFVLL